MTGSTLPYDFIAPPASMPRGNVTTAVTDILRRAIVTLELAPGEIIDKTALCIRLGVSRFPVSEALARLAAEGLVDIRPQRGTIVSLIRIGEVAEFMLIRKALEVEAVRALVDQASPEALAGLRASVSTQLAAAAQNDRLGFHLADCEFHDLLTAALQFDRVKSVIDTARAYVDRARRLINSPRRLALTIAEHQAIVDAIAASDADAAAAAMRAHINAVMAELTTFAQSHPENFAPSTTSGPAGETPDDAHAH